MCILHEHWKQACQQCKSGCLEFVVSLVLCVPVERSPPVLERFPRVAEFSPSGHAWSRLSWRRRLAVLFARS